jgi:hydrogenase 3 maturation protease
MRRPMNRKKSEIATICTEKARRLAFMCIGNILCSDDAAGMKFAELIKNKAESKGCIVIECSTAPENFTGVLREYRPDRVIFVDAAHMTKAPGEVFIIDKKDIKGAYFSTHMLPLNVLTDYIEKEICKDTVVVGIQPVSCEAGTDMYPEVSASVKELADAFCESISNSI